MKVQKYFGLLSLAAMLLLAPAKADAAVVTKENITLNGEWQNYTVAATGDCNRHAITVTQAGELNVKLQAFCRYNYANLRDPDLEEYYHNGLWGSQSDPKTADMVFDVLPGTYYVEFECYNDPGDYRIKASFTAADNNEKEPNNTYATAQALSFNQQVTGFLTKDIGSDYYNDLNDYYKFTVTEKQKVKVTYTPEKGNGIINIYTSDLTRIKREWRYSTDPYVCEQELDPGTYYILIESANNAGKYTLLVEPEQKPLEEGNTVTDTDSNAIYRVISEDESVCFVVEQPAKANITNFVVPDTVTVNNQQVKVTEIADNAFADCTSLQTVTIGNNVEKIGEKAFSNCTSLKNVTVGSSVTKIGANAFSNCNSLTTVSGCKNVATVGKNAFYKCTNLKTIGSTKNTVTLSKVSAIGTKAFYGCKKLKKVNVTSTKLKKIYTSAFQGCSSVTKINVKSKKLTSIGSKAFYNCKSLKTLTLQSKKIKSVGKNVFKGIKSSAKVRVPASKLSAYKKLMKKSRTGSRVKIVKF